MARIGIDIHCIGDRQTGNETYVRNLVHGLEESSAAAHEYLYYHTRSARDADALQGLAPATRLKRVRPGTPLIRLPFGLPRALRRDRVDLAHFQYVLPPFCPCPAVVTVHDISYEFFPEFFGAAERTRYHHTVSWSARRARAVIAVSECTRQDLIKTYGIPGEKITVTYEAVDPAFRPQDRAAALANVSKRWKLPRPYVLAVGNLRPRKNAIRLVAAFAQLLQEHRLPRETVPDLVFAGPPAADAHPLRRAVRNAGLSERVHFLGYVTQPELVTLYNGARCLAYPSLYEGFGLPVVEAMACGTPVVASSGGSLPEVAGEAAEFFDPLDVGELTRALLRVLSDEDRARQLSQAGRRRSQRFGRAVVASATQAVYQQCLEDTEGPR